MCRGEFKEAREGKKFHRVALIEYQILRATCLYELLLYYLYYIFLRSDNTITYYKL